MKRRKSKTTFLTKLERVEVSGSPRTASTVVSDIWEKLWDTQKPAVQFTLERKASFLSMETGTGKTFVTLASLAIKHARGEVNKVLITCPKPAIHVWKREINKWLHGTDIEFYILSYETTKGYFKYMKKIGWDAMVCDESHKLKNHASQQSRRIAIIGKSAEHRYCLTGTPVAESVIDLYGQFEFLEPTVLVQGKKDRWAHFKDMYCYSTGFMGYELKITDRNRDRILSLVHPYTYEVTSEQQGRPKAATPVYLMAELKGTQRRLYRELEAKMITEYKDSTVIAPRVITQMLRLQQICGGHVKDDEGGIITFESDKYRVLDEFLQQYKKRNQKLVIFARFIHELSQIKKICKYNGMTAEIYSTKDPSLEDRFQKTDQFPQVFITQYQKGSEALTLTCAPADLFFSRSHSYINWRQATSRIDRPPQTQPVEHYIIQTRGTVEDSIDLAVKNKQSGADHAKAFLKTLTNALKLNKVKDVNNPKESIMTDNDNTPTTEANDKPAAKKAPKKAPVAKKATTKKVAAKKPAKKEAAEKAAYGVDYIAKQLKKETGSVRIALRNAKVKKSGRSYGWNTKAEADAVISKLKKAA